MTEYEVVWSPKAIERVKAIEEYIKVDLGAPQTALQIKKRLHKAAGSLSQMPERYPVDPEVKEYHYLVEHNYFIYLTSYW